MVGPSNGDLELIVNFGRMSKKCFYSKCPRRPPEKSLAKHCIDANNPFSIPKAYAVAQVIPI